MTYSPAMPTYLNDLMVEHRLLVAPDIDGDTLQWVAGAIDPNANTYVDDGIIDIVLEIWGSGSTPLGAVQAAIAKINARDAREQRCVCSHDHGDHFYTFGGEAGCSFQVENLICLCDGFVRE